MNVIYWSLFIIVFLPVSKSDYILYEVTAFNPNERGLLYSMHLNMPAITFLNGVTNEAAIPMDVIVKRDAAQIFEHSLQSKNIQYKHISRVKS